MSVFDEKFKKKCIDTMSKDEVELAAAECTASDLLIKNGVGSDSIRGYLNRYMKYQIENNPHHVFDVISSLVYLERTVNLDNNHGAFTTLALAYFIEMHRSEGKSPSEVLKNYDQLTDFLAWSQAYGAELITLEYPEVANHYLEADYEGWIKPNAEIHEDNWSKLWHPVSLTD